MLCEGLLRVLYVGHDGVRSRIWQVSISHRTPTTNPSWYMTAPTLIQSTPLKTWFSGVYARFRATRRVTSHQHIKRRISHTVPIYLTATFKKPDSIDSHQNLGFLCVRALQGYADAYFILVTTSTRMKRISYLFKGTSNPLNILIDRLPRKTLR